MKQLSLKFFVIKFIIYTLFNAVAFGVFLLADMMFTKFMPNEFIQRALFFSAGFAAFEIMCFSVISKMKKSDLPFVQFVLYESLSYMVFLLVPTTASLVIGIDGVTDNLFTLFFAPQFAFHHLTSYPVLGYILNSLVFTLVACLAHAKNIRHYNKTDNGI